MTSTSSRPDTTRAVAGAAGLPVTGQRRRGPRLALLCAAVAILLLGAAVAGVSAYLMINRSPVAVTGTGPRG